MILTFDNSTSFFNQIIFSLAKLFWSFESINAVMLNFPAILNFYCYFFSNDFLTNITSFSSKSVRKLPVLFIFCGIYETFVYCCLRKPNIGNRFCRDKTRLFESSRPKGLASSRPTCWASSRPNSLASSRPTGLATCICKKQKSTITFQPRKF